VNSKADWTALKLVAEMEGKKEIRLEMQRAALKDFEPVVVTDRSWAEAWDTMKASPLETSWVYRKEYSMEQMSDH
jgi:CTP:molybdopterin cytidylyltransferase MocA